MSRIDNLSIIVGIIFLILFIYPVYFKSYLYALGCLILSTALFKGAYTPVDTDRREVLIITIVTFYFIAVSIFVYALIY